MRMIVLAAAACVAVTFAQVEARAEGAGCSSPQRRLHQLRLSNARPMRGQCYGNRRVLRALR